MATARMQCLRTNLPQVNAVAASSERSAVKPAMPAKAFGRSVSFQTSFMGQELVSTSHARVACRSSVKAPVVASLTSISMEGNGANKAPAPSTSSSTDSPAPVQEVELKSEMGIDYTELKALFEKDDWRGADDWTRATLIKLAGDGAELREWVYFSEVTTIPADDLITLDALWRAYSDGRYGYSVQRRIWVKCKKDYAKFFKQIDWIYGPNNRYRHWPEDFLYKKNAAAGHFPLTSALRGTQLMEKIFEHPAIVKAEKDAGYSIKL